MINDAIAMIMVTKSYEIKKAWFKEREEKTRKLKEIQEAKEILKKTVKIEVKTSLFD